jgi:hypothetical protein
VGSVDCTTVPARPGESDRVQPAQLSGEGAPGLTGAPLGDPDQQQREPAEQDVGLKPMEHRAQLGSTIELRGRW